MKNTTRKEIVAKTSKLFFFATLLTAFATAGSAQETKKVEKDGFVWYTISVWRNGDHYEGALDANKKTIIPANKYQHISYEEIKDNTSNRITGHYFCPYIINNTEKYDCDGVIFLDGTVAYEPTRKYSSVSMYSALDGNLLYIYPHQMGINLKQMEFEFLLQDPITGNFKRIAHEKARDFGGVTYEKNGYFRVWTGDNSDKYYDTFGEFLYEGKYLVCQKDKVTNDYGDNGKVILNTSMAEYNVKKCAEKYAKYQKSNPNAAMTYCRIAAFFINEVDPGVVKDAEFLAKLGSIMEKGEGVTVNTKKAKELYAQAEKAGYAPAGPMLKALNDKEKPITIIGDLPAGVKDIDLYLMTEEDLLKYAQQGYLIPLREYCKQKLFFTYGTMWYNEAENKVVVDEKTTKKITDKEANEVLRLLESGATQDASCQFMLACLYSGMKCLGIKTDTTVFSYTDYNKAKAYLTKFQSNPKRKEADCFAQPQAVVEWISNNIKKL